jgi:hypothetical protein
MGDQTMNDDPIMDMGDDLRRAFAAIMVGFRLLPASRKTPHEPIRDGGKARFLRALEFIAYSRDGRPTYSGAAAAIGVKRGTVSSWISRDSRFRKEAERLCGISDQPEYSLYCWDQVARPPDSPPGTTLDWVEAVARLPQDEIDWIAAGRIPSAWLMSRAFPDHEEETSPGRSTRWLAEFPSVQTPKPGHGYAEEIDPE